MTSSRPSPSASESCCLQHSQSNQRDDSSISRLPFEIWALSHLSLVLRRVQRQEARPTWGPSGPKSPGKQGFPVSEGHLDLSNY